MIIVLGRPRIAEGPIGPVPAGLACSVAIAAAAAGGRVELVGSVGDDRAGDAAAIGLARAGVGHAALLRIAAVPTPRASTADAATRLDAADVELGLRYLSDLRVLVVADTLEDEIASVAADAAAYASAAVIAVVQRGDPPPRAFDRSATILEAPEDAEGPFAVAVARYAVALDAGGDPESALREAVGAAGWEPIA